MKAIQLYDKFDEEIVGTVLLKTNVDFGDITNAWDEYQEFHNSNSENWNIPDIYHFASLNNTLCEVLDLDFYQPAH